MHSITFKAALIAEAMASSGRTFAVELHELKVEALDLALNRLFKLNQSCDSLEPGLLRWLKYSCRWQPKSQQRTPLVDFVSGTHCGCGGAEKADMIWST